MEKGTVRKLVEIKRALRKKYLSLRRGIIDTTNENEKNLEPIIKPLNKLIEKATKKNVVTFKKIEKSEPLEDDKSFAEDFTENYADSMSDDNDAFVDDANDELTNLHSTSDDPVRFALPTKSAPRVIPFTDPEYYKELLASKGPNVDRIFGVKYNNGVYYMGKHHVEIMSDHIKIGEKIYPATKGLYELLTSKVPKFFNDDDLNLYKQILKQTGVHLSLKTGRVKSRKTHKYSKIIKDLFKKNSLPGKSGASYKYWDNADELVDRLRLLIASSGAGNKGHRNEIIEIIEELREANIIY